MLPAIALAAVALLFVARRLGPAEAWLARLARRHRLAIGVVFALSLVLSAIGTAIRRPVPQAENEFSYLLAADTFARFRLANPPHPLKEFFQVNHVLHDPVYASKYPPGQGIALAAGQLLGDPVIGVWLSTALAAAALLWMAQAWLPPRWALVAALLFVFHARLQVVWGQSFWGGQVALVGGALLFGALARLWRQPGWPAAVTFALGLAILANSRPYEGLVAGFCACAALAWRLARGPHSHRAIGKQILLPAAGVLAAAAVAMLAYNYRLTGSALLLPHQLYQEQHLDNRPHFLWQPWQSRPSDYFARTGVSHPDVRNADRACARRDWGGWLRFRAADACALGAFFFHFTALPTLAIPLLWLLWRGAGGWPLFAAATIAACILAASATSYPIFPQYLAPVVPLLFLMVAAGMRRLRCWHGTPLLDGPSAVRALLLIEAAPLVLYWAIVALSPYGHADTWAHARERMQSELKRMPGRHLVIVRYRPDHHPFEEWAYNAADIDGAGVVWARETPKRQPAPNRQRLRQLLDHYADRQVWLLEADALPLRLTPYPHPLPAMHAGAAKLSRAADKR